MKFRYIASQPDGQIVESEIDAQNVSEVLIYLAKTGLRPVSVRPVERGVRLGFRFLRGRINLTDQIFISKYLALMLKIGTGLLEAVNILIADFQKDAVKEILLEVRSTLEQGKPFYTTFANYPKIFSPVYVNLIRAGEVSGNLEKVFEDLTTILTKNKELRDQIRNAFVYPTLLLAGSLFIFSFMIFYALPKIANVFSETGFEPPLFSRLVFGLGVFLQKAGWYLLVFFIAGVVIFLRSLKTSVVFRRFVAGIGSEVPVVRDIVKKIALQRFSSILASLIRAGLPLTESLEITAQAVGNAELREALIRISREGLAKGLTVGESFRKEPFFPQTVINLIAISEKAGHIENILETLSDFYTKEIDATLKTLVSFLEPALLLFIGVVISVIALAVIIPIYQLTTQF